ncbi:hypothetical protein, partial [Anditalea andensis]|uniref:hypothetical protein n=1 Tax=Anditalea andensis TaxID=1048983 RepID=UPI001969FEF2
GQNKSVLHFFTGGFTPGYDITPRWGCRGTAVFTKTGMTYAIPLSTLTTSIYPLILVILLKG